MNVINVHGEKVKSILVLANGSTLFTWTNL